MSTNDPTRKPGPRPRRAVAALIVVAVALAALACGGGNQAGGGGNREDAGSSSSGAAVRGGASGESGVDSGGATTTEMAGGEATVSSRGTGEAAELARAEVGPKEISNMLPADGKRPDKARPLPDNPPEGIRVYPATTNRTTEKPIAYDREPPTNGDHDTSWQNCGFYERPLNDRHVVHSMDHGVVWITYQPNLPEAQVDTLRSYGDEDYVVVSPYPGQDAPVIATSWRVQLELDGANDPRLREFVDDFRVSEIAPLSGNRCVGGVGNPA